MVFSEPSSSASMRACSVFSCCSRASASVHFSLLPLPDFLPFEEALEPVSSSYSLSNRSISLLAFCTSSFVAVWLLTRRSYVRFASIQSSYTSRASCWYDKPDSCFLSELARYWLTVSFWLSICPFSIDITSCNFSPASPLSFMNAWVSALALACAPDCTLLRSLYTLTLRLVSSTRNSILSCSWTLFSSLYASVRLITAICSIEYLSVSREHLMPSSA